MSHNIPDKNASDRLTILQLNTNKSDKCMHDFLQGNDAGVIAIQEPYIDFLGCTRALPHLRVVYPTQHLDNYAKPTTRTRSLLLLNTKLPTDCWTQLPIDSPDVTAVQLTGEFGTLRIFNIYNDGENDNALEAIQQWQRNPEARHIPRAPLNTIWLGDFNRHHPMWDKPRNHHLFTAQNLAAAQRLLTLMAENALHMALPESIPTLKSFSTGNYTRVDNVFGTKGVLDRIITCDTRPGLRPIKTDHFPIVTEIDMTMGVTDVRERRNWKTVDWEEFNKRLEEKMAKLAAPKEIETEEEFWKVLEELDTAVGEVVEEKVAVVKSSPKQRQWWSKEISAMKAVKGNLSNRSYRMRTDPAHPVHEEFRRVRQMMTTEIRKAKADTWVEYLANASASTMWSAGKMVEGKPTDGGRSRIPKLWTTDERGAKKLVGDNMGKVKVFREAFFPPPPAESRVPRTAEYPEAAWTFTLPTDRRLKNAIGRMKNGKATRMGTIPNNLFKACSDLLIPQLGPIYRATYNLKNPSKELGTE